MSGSAPARPPSPGLGAARAALTRAWREQVTQILELEEVPSLGAFTAIFEEPTGLALSEDRVWPPNRPLVY